MHHFTNTMKKLLFIALALMLAGCKQETEMKPAGAQETQSNVTTGKVLEVIDVGTYTYLRLDEQGYETWVATSPTWVAEGDVVRYSGGDLMKDFRSEKLQRTFDYIVFVSGVELVDAPDSQAHPAAAMPGGHPEIHAGTTERTTLPESIMIEPLEGGVTVVDLYSGAEALAGAEVSVRAIVVKVNNGIMGKNWVTIQDGTGTHPDNLLITTTLENLAVGTEVVATGTVATNVSLGYGYDYKVLLENTRFESQAGQ